MNSKRRIFFVCPDHNFPTGGIKQIYRQADALNNNGFEAYILHENVGFKCTWFKNTTKVQYNSDVFQQLLQIANTETKTSALLFLKKIVKNSIAFPKFYKRLINKSKNVQFGSNDILVFPEVYGPYLCNVQKGIKKVIYNQGCYQTFFKHDLSKNLTETPYLHPDLMATIVNSEDAFQYIKHAFPKMNLYRVHYGIDKVRFYYSEHKKMQLAFMPRRLRVDLVQVINILKYRGVLKDWELKPIDGMSEDQVAELMRESAFFLSFSINEGFGMPPAEAMACGCIAVGYPGHGGNEYFKDEFSYPIPNRDVQQYAKTLEALLLDYQKNKEMYLRKGKEASEFILKEYAMEVENEDIVGVWKKIVQLN